MVVAKIYPSYITAWSI